MDESNIIVAIIGDYWKAETAPSFLIDHGMQLQIMGVELPHVFEAHFSNSKKTDAKRQIGTDNVVIIPDEYFLSGAAQIYCWIYLHPTENSGVTKYEIVIPLRQRPGVDPSEPTPEQEDIIDQAIAALNAAVEQTGQDAASAAASAADALASEQAAAASKVNAADSESKAAASAAAAANSESAAAESEINAAASEANAAQSATDAYESAERAEQAATTAGYLDVDIVDGDLIYTRTDAVDVDFDLIDGNLVMEAV